MPRKISRFRRNHVFLPFRVSTDMEYFETITLCHDISKQAEKRATLSESYPPGKAAFIVKMACRYARHPRRSILSSPNIFLYFSNFFIQFSKSIYLLFPSFVFLILPILFDFAYSFLYFFTSLP